MPQQSDREGEVLRVHATAVAFGGRAVLLRGPSGSGKSDLALRLLAFYGPGGLPMGMAGVAKTDADVARLIADDQVLITRQADHLTASPPATIAGKIEVRGLGIIDVPHVASARLALVCDLVERLNVPRMPPAPWPHANLLGCAVPLIRLYAFEAATPIKVQLALAEVHGLANEAH